MRILSKFHDYYDTAMGYGQDPALIYNRVTEQVEVTSWPWDPRIIDLLVCRADFVHPAALGFCGRVYPIWIDLNVKVNAEFFSNDTSPDCSLSVEELIKQVHMDRSNRDPSWLSRRSIVRNLEFVTESVSKAYKKSQEFHGTTVDDRIFRDLNCPSFLVLDGPYWHTRTFSGGIIKNPRLATLGFQKEMDAFSAFQEIAMFLGSNLAAEPIAPSTVGDDELIARSKGFDEQSFRTAAPGQKKLNRKQNRQAKKEKREEP